MLDTAVEPIFQGDYEATEKFYIEALKLNPEVSMSLCFQSTHTHTQNSACIQNHRYLKPEPEFRVWTAITCYPRQQHVRSLCNYGALLHNIYSKHDEAVVMYERALAVRV